MLQIATTKSLTVKKAGEGITKAFKSVDTVALPHPGKGVSRKSVKVPLKSKQIT